MLQLKGASPLTPFDIIYFQEVKKVSGLKATNCLFLTHEFKKMLQLQGASPLTPFDIIYFQVFPGG